MKNLVMLLALGIIPFDFAMSADNLQGAATTAANPMQIAVSQFQARGQQIIMSTNDPNGITQEQYAEIMSGINSQSYQDRKRQYESVLENYYNQKAILLMKPKSEARDAEAKALDAAFHELRAESTRVRRDLQDKEESYQKALITAGDLDDNIVVIQGESELIKARNDEITGFKVDGVLVNDFLTNPPDPATSPRLNAAEKERRRLTRANFEDNNEILEGNILKIEAAQAQVAIAQTVVSEALESVETADRTNTAQQASIEQSRSAVRLKDEEAELAFFKATGQERTERDDIPHVYDSVVSAVSDQVITDMKQNGRLLDYIFEELTEEEKALDETSDLLKSLKAESEDYLDKTRMAMYIEKKFNKLLDDMGRNPAGEACGKTMACIAGNLASITNLTDAPQGDCKPGQTEEIEQTNAQANGSLSLEEVGGEAEVIEQEDSGVQVIELSQPVRAVAGEGQATDLSQGEVNSILDIDSDE